MSALGDRLRAAHGQDFDANVREYLRFLDHKEGEWIELQAIGIRNRSRCGLPRYADNAFAHVATVSEAVTLLALADAQLDAQGLYVIQNRIDPAVKARGISGKWNPQGKGSGTSDRDITSRRAMYIDADPVRVRGVSATKAESDAAPRKAVEIYKFVAGILGDERSLGFGFSGSGAQIHIALDDSPNDKDTETLIKEIYAGLSSLHSDKLVHVDTSVSDAKRIGPAWGTKKRKGTDDAERPHRKTWFSAPADVRRLSLDELRMLHDAIIAKVPSKPTETKSVTKPKVGDGAFEACERIPIRDVLSKLGLDPASPTCPACGAGGNSSVAVLDDRNVIKCLHVTCDKAAYGSVRVVAKVIAGVETLKGNKAACRIVLEWFATNFGVEIGPQKRAKPSVTAKTTTVTTADNTSELSELPTIMLGVDTHRVVEEAVAAIGQDPEVYSRGERLVRVVDGDAGTVTGATMPRGPIASNIAPSVLGAVYLSRCAAWEQIRKGEPVPASVPVMVANAIHDLRYWKGVRPLVSITETPVLRPDGTVLDTAGYDASTGIIYRPSGEYEPVTASPTRADAERARDALLEVVCDMPLSEASRAAWLSMVLSYFARPMISGPVPIYLADGNTPGVSKSLSIRAAALIATGRDPAMIQYAEDQDEMEKRITAILLRGYPFFYFDNLADGGVFGGPKLEALATADIWGGRLLGKTEQLDLPQRSIIAATGNNVVVRGAMLRRVVVLRFESSIERPEDRVDFRHPDLLGWVRENRPRLVNAALTLIRAWMQAGRPTIGVTLGTYPSWCSTVGEVVAWITGVDVTETRRQLEHREGSGDVHQVRPLMTAWREVFGDAEGTVTELLRILRDEDVRVAGVRRRAERGDDLGDDGRHRYERLRDTVRAFAPGKGELPDRTYLGRRLGAVHRRVVDGLRFDRRLDRDGVCHWWVEAPEPGLRGLRGDCAGTEFQSKSPQDPVEKTRARITSAGTAGTEIVPSSINRDFLISENTDTGVIDDPSLLLGAGVPKQSPQSPHNPESSTNTSVEPAGTEISASPRTVPAVPARRVRAMSAKVTPIDIPGHGLHLRLTIELRSEDGTALYDYRVVPTTDYVQSAVTGRLRDLLDLYGWQGVVTGEIFTGFVGVVVVEFDANVGRVVRVLKDAA